MLKFIVILSIVAVACIMPMNQADAFKVVTVQKSISAPAGAPAFDPNALIQSVQKAIAGKVQQVQTLVGSLVQQKQATIASLQKQLGGLQPPFVIRKQIFIGKPATASTAATPEATTTVEGY